MKKKNKMQKIRFDQVDMWGEFANWLFRKKNTIAEAVWSFFVKAKCRFWKINYGKRCRFIGNIVLRRKPGSRIIIGNDCRFRSAKWSNLAGINRPCYLCTLGREAKIVIGKRSGFSGTVISAMESIEIGDDVLCGTNVTITDTDWHPVARELDRNTNIQHAAVKIGNNVWLGMGVIVLKGVSIGDKSIIAPNSVVVHDIPSGVLAGGQPAERIRFL